MANSRSNDLIRTDRRHTDASSSIVPSGRAKVFERLSQFSDEEITQRKREISHQLRANGIAYGVGSGHQYNARPWRLDLMPQVIEPAQWQQLAEGLEQRSRLKQAMLADIYTDQALLHDGIVPPALVFGHRGYLRRSVKLPATDELPLYSVDVSRASSGDWYVVNDCCQAPFGIGYTLENRLVLSHVLPGLYREARVCRVASWFRALRAYLASVIDSDARCVMLAYGAGHPHYFEHMYFAKYLGYTLVELNDLTVRNERVWLKTVAGLQRVHVILRFIEDADTDPVALASGTGTGVAGLLHAVEAGTVRLINPVGAGVLDNPAFDAYLPALCRYYLSETAKLHSTPTYWLGDPEQREMALSSHDRLLFRHIDSREETFDPDTLPQTETRALLNRIELIPEHYIAQERIDRTTVPSLVEQDNTPRQITLRTYLLNTDEGTRVMDGALGLLDSVGSGKRPSMDELVGSQDVWILSNTPVVRDTLLPQAESTLHYAVLEGELPSRVADNLFWFGRYLELAEGIARVMRSICNEMLSDDRPVDTNEPDHALFALLRAATAVTGTSPGFTGRGGRRRLASPDRELQSLLLDGARSGTLADALNQLQRTAGSVRDRVSPDLIRILNELGDCQLNIAASPTARQFSNNPLALNQTVDHLNNLLSSMAALAGLVNENMTRGDGWRFLMLGRRIERARLSTAVLATLLIKGDRDQRLLENTLRLFDSLITYRGRYRSQLDDRLVVHLLALDEGNPRSIAFQFQRIDSLVRELPGMRRAAYQDALLRLSTAALSRVRLVDPEQLLCASPASRQTLKAFLQIIGQLSLDISDALSANYFTHTEAMHNLILSDANAAVRAPRGVRAS